MNQKYIGVFMIIMGLLLASFVYMSKEREDRHIKLLIEEQDGYCYLDDGTCLHEDRDYTLFIFGWALSGILVFLGIYLIFLDNTMKILAEHQVKVSSALRDAKKEETHKDKFNAFLAGFEKDEQSVLAAIKDQDGIKQSTLRYRTGMSKTSLSLMLKELEKKEIISRKKSGKTNEVFLRKKF